MEHSTDNKSKEKPKISPESSKFKTEICRNWKNGQCRYGSNCFFAHGEHELRPSTSAPVKSYRCSQFYDLGYCPYGTQCAYKHQEKSAESQAIPKSNSGESLKKRLPVFLKLSQEPLRAQV